MPAGMSRVDEKCLVEPLTADHEQGLFADVNGADSKQAEGRAIGQFFALQKCATRPGRSG